MTKARTLEVTVKARVPKDMTPRHFRQLIKDQLDGGSGIYLSLQDQVEANTNAGKINPTVSAARRSA